MREVYSVPTWAIAGFIIYGTGVGILYQSEDHSLVNELVHSGNLTPEEAIGHSRSNVITRCIRHVEKGLERPAATTLQIEDVEEGIIFSFVLTVS